MSASRQHSQSTSSEHSAELEASPQNSIAQADSSKQRTTDQQHTANPLPVEIGGRNGPEPTRFGDWEKGGRCIDF